jgi:hypothetical protein
MQPWQALGALPPRVATKERRAQRWWQDLLWASMLGRLVLPSPALWLWAWLRPEALGSPLWRIGILLAASYNSWALQWPLWILFQAGKEWLYRAWARGIANLAAIGAFSGLTALGWTLWRGQGRAAGPAASLGWMGLGLGLGFCGQALAAMGRGHRTLRLAELDPARATDFPPPTRPGPRLRVAHLSDLHLTANPSTKSTTGKPGGNRAFQALLKAHAKTLRSRQTILLTGDLADAGRATEWKAFFKAWDRLGLDGRAVLAPGNHEINIIDPGDRFAVDPAHTLRAKRLVRTLAALDKVQGPRAWVLGPQGPQTLRHYLAGHAPALLGFIRDPAWDAPSGGFLSQLSFALTGGWPRNSRAARDRLEGINRIWDQAFPMLVELPGTRALAVVLDSNVAAVGFWDNALGDLKAAQLARVTALLAHPRFRGKPVLWMLHHHVALPELPWSFLRVLEADLMTLRNPQALLRALPPGPQLVLHGHKHLAYFGRLPEPVQIVCAPSSTLEDERRPERPLGFFTFEIALGPGQAALAGPPKFRTYHSEKIGP